MRWTSTAGSAAYTMGRLLHQEHQHRLALLQRRRFRYDGGRGDPKHRALQRQRRNDRTRVHRRARTTVTTSAPTRSAVWWALAYDYLYDANGNWVNVENRGAEIANCAIAGYTIEDNSTNPLQLGEAVVGGLIGVSKVDLNRLLGGGRYQGQLHTPRGRRQRQTTRAQYGNFVRVGGLVGGVQYKGDELLHRRLNHRRRRYAQRARGQERKPCHREDQYREGDRGREREGDLCLHRRESAAAGFSSNFRNFPTRTARMTEGRSMRTATPIWGRRPCRGTIMAISRIGSVADRYEWAPSVTITNCYYYAESDVQYNLPEVSLRQKESCDDPGER